MIGAGKRKPAKGPGGRVESMNRRARLVVVTLPMLLMLAAGTAFILSYGSPRQYPVRSLLPPPAAEQQNGVWLGHRWFSGKFSDAELSELVERIRRYHFAYLFVHAGPLDRFGRVAEIEGPGVVRLRAALAGAGLPVKILAWLGGKNAEFGHWLDLNDPSTRSGIVDTVTAMLAQNPMDGVHFDIEPIRNGDPEFLLLLEEVRKSALTPGQMLSVATYQLRPTWIPAFVLPAWYTPEYMGEVARRVDQIAVMTYDTGMPLPGLYQRWLETQVRRIVPVVSAVCASRARTEGMPGSAGRGAVGKSGQEPAQEAGQETGQKTGQETGQKSGQNTGLNTGQKTGQKGGQNTGQETGQKPGQQTGQDEQGGELLPGFSLLFGVPSYEEPRLGHWPPAENVVAASQALVAVFADVRNKAGVRLGYALYAEWTTDAAEWTALERLWR